MCSSTQTYFQIDVNTVRIVTRWYRFVTRYHIDARLTDDRRHEFHLIE